MFKEYDVVKLRADRSDDQLKAGAIGAVVMVYHSDPAAYEVEFCNQSGVTLALLTLLDSDLELA